MSLCLHRCSAKRVREQSGIDRSPACPPDTARLGFHVLLGAGPPEASRSVSGRCHPEFERPTAEAILWQVNVGPNVGKMWELIH